MHWCYLEAKSWSESPLIIEGEEAQHALKVMRLSVGGECGIFDGCGRVVRARIIHCDGKRSMQLQIEEELPCALPASEIELALAIPKGGNMELIIQKAVELGVSRITPLLSERTIVRLKQGEAQAKQAKWQRTALEACKQCKAAYLPQVAPVQSLAQFLQEPPAEKRSLKLCCALVAHAQPMRHYGEQARAQGIKRAQILIGPEGDFSPQEYKAIEAAGFAPASLGALILRVETATFMAIAQMHYALAPA